MTKKKKRKPTKVVAKAVLSVVELARQIRHNRNWDAEQKAKMENKKLRDNYNLAYSLIAPFETETSVNLGRFFEFKAETYQSLDLFEERLFFFQKRRAIIEIEIKPDYWQVSWRYPKSKEYLARPIWVQDSTLGDGRERLKEHIAEVMSYWII